MGKKENTSEKLMFTTVNIFNEILKKVQGLAGIEPEIQQYKYVYVVHKVLSHLNVHKSDTQGCKINIEYLGKLFGTSNSYTAGVLRNLINWNIIRKSVPAGKGVSARYLITNQYQDDRQVIIPVTSSDASFITKLNKYKKDELTDKFLSKSFNLIESFLSINNDGYSYLNNKYQLFLSNEPVSLLDGVENLKIAFLTSKAELLALKNKRKSNGGYGIERRDIPLFLILIKEYNCSRPLDRNGNQSRVYNNLTNLPREHRRYVNLCGKPLLMTDISNSQILLTVPMIEKHYKIHSGKGAVGMPNDIVKFKQWAESGEFYEKFSKLLYPAEMTKGQRIELKLMIFRVLWFGKTNRFKNMNRVKSVFIKNFPNVYDIIKVLKVKDYKQFSIELQRFEASIIVDRVAKKMLSKYPILTLHDAIVCTSTEALCDAESRIAKELTKYNLTPKFKREDESKYVTHAQPVYVPEANITAPLKKSLSQIKPLEKRNF
jgi:hypothetical protein